MKLKIFRNISITAISALLFVSSVSAESLADKIKKRSGEMSEVRALLNDSDQNTRLAAMDIMLKSDDTAMRELAYTTGFNSADDTMRAIALRNKFNELDTLTMYFTLPENATEKDKTQFEWFGGSLSLVFSGYDEKTGKFKSYGTKSPGGSYTKVGNVSGLALNFNTRYCSGSLILNDESELQGVVTCQTNKFSAKASII